jgi:hypothetical protein
VLRFVLTNWLPDLNPQEFEAGTADNFASFPQQNGMLTCYNLLFVSSLSLPPIDHACAATARLSVQPSLRCLRPNQ